MKRGYFTSFLYLISLILPASTFAAGPNGRVSGPDFAFPKTVSKNAYVEYEKAMAAGDGEHALAAAIKLDIADALISSSSFMTSADRFDSIAVAAKTPWNSLAWLVEAKLYSDLYKSRSWVFDSRQLPESPVPEDVSEWSGKMFRNKIRCLVEKAINNQDKTEQLPISDIQSVLTDCQDAIKDGFSVMDFISMQVTDILSPFNIKDNFEVIPFGVVSTVSDSDLSENVINDAIQRNCQKDNLAVLSFFMELKLNTLPAQKRYDYALECLKKLEGSPYCVPFLCAIWYNRPGNEEDIESRNKIRREFLRKFKDYKTNFPEARGISSLESVINGLCDRNINISFPNRILANNADTIKISGANLYDFKILIYSLPIEAGEREYDFSDVVKKGKFIQSLSVELSGQTPDLVEKNILVPELAPGCYAFIPSLTEKINDAVNGREHAVAATSIVSDIYIFNSSDYRVGAGPVKTDFFVVSATDNKPVEDAKITFEKTDRNNKVLSRTVSTTDKDGRVTVDAASYNYLVEYKGNRLPGSYYYYSQSRPSDTDKVQIKGTLLTDLGIYHPGDTIKFAGIFYRQKEKNLTLCESETIELSLLDANYQKIDSCSVSTDMLGRANGRFILPKSGLLGTWHLAADNNERNICNAYFQIADYRQPAFIVNINSSSATDGKEEETLLFQGNAVTYTGMPVAGAKISYEVTYQPFLWRSSNVNASFGGNTLTDDDGKFTISLETKGLKNTEFEHGRFILKVNATDKTGETVSSPGIGFSIGNEFLLTPDIPSRIECDGDSINLNVKCIDGVGHPVVKPIYFEISSGNDIVRKGEFVSPLLTLDVSSLPSGEYKLRFSLEPSFTEENKTEDTGAIVTRKTVFWRKSDMKPPVTTMLWTDFPTITAPEKSRNVKIRVGSSYPGEYILAQICDSHKIIEYRWIKVKTGFEELEVPVPAEDEQIFINLFAMHDLEKCETTVKVIPYLQAQPLIGRIESFRDNISPGDREQWKFSFSFAGKEQSNIPVMALMTDKAINSLAPNPWTFNPAGSLYWSSASKLMSRNIYMRSSYMQAPVKSVISKNNQFVAPALQLYGYSLIGLSSSRSRLYRKAAFAGTTLATKAEVTDAGSTAEGEYAMAMNVMAEGAMESSDEAAVFDSETPSTDLTDYSDVELRDPDLAVAFFNPNLQTDSNGNVVLEFRAPEFIGTWHLQVLGYTPELKGTTLNLDAVSTKKVMAELNAPRFARTGDLLNVSANIYNNSSSVQKTAGRLEFINTNSGEVLYSFMPESSDVEPSRFVTVTAGFKIPTEIDFMTIRVYGETEGYSDGEQVIIPILPSSEPVIESAPFYIAPGVTSYDMMLPAINKNAKVTLTYCDNPVWECVTALPALISPESVSILSQARALYGNCIAAGLFARYPELMKGVLDMAGESESELISPLQKNPLLKNLILDNTPWVNNEKSETLRMQSLVKYSDKELTERSIGGIVKSLRDRRNPDGGWGWCPGMESADFITISVFKILSHLEKMGYLPDEARELALTAAKYIDKSLAGRWIKSGRKSFPTELLIDYLNCKSVFRNIGSASGFAGLEKEAMKVIEADWRKFGILEKATAAMLLERKGKTRTSRLILESLRQYASESEEKGMWFDNLNSEYNGFGPVLTTAGVLEAFAFIEPDNPAIEKIRQWLLISKQTQDWGSEVVTASAINAVLSSGSDWHSSEGKKPKIYFDGKEFTVLSFLKASDSFTIDIPASVASGARLTIERNGSGPSWGGIISQFVSPISEVKAARVPSLSVKKEIYYITEDNRAVALSDVNIKPGDKVRITLTLIADNNLDYVAITDSRAACMEPADKLSGYNYIGGIGMYREIRDTSTNLFIPFLPKGTHVLSYDCFVDRSGEYASGIATAQSQYAPVICAHSAGMTVVSDQ